MKTFAQNFTYTFIFYFLVCFTVPQQAYSQPPIREPGKCYAKCLIGNQFEYWEESYPIYLGEYDRNLDYLEEMELILHGGTTKWVKRTADKNCLSADPNDCLVWVLIEVPEEIEIITIVTDTSQTPDYEWETFEFSALIEKGGFTEWKEVVCNYKVNAELKEQIQQALTDYEYYTGPINGLIGTETKAALVKFQKDNALPIGSLDIETMEALEIDY